ncbi:hypothetical protein [Ancylobacter rudongensis]|uniref:Uncharacterized protein n=1 Tax=Ancylobacter rudongensis TaxID=177413 RepID=A0A1G4UP42_9HYPH|nr:hypothetical protein [Ancylobacter rudongensis]SCW95408.1 hypothetical protein SAMN05660859_0020 [Ancylobacter rudongensis]
MNTVLVLATIITIFQGGKLEPRVTVVEAMTPAQCESWKSMSRGKTPLVDYSTNRAVSAQHYVCAAVDAKVLPAGVR